MQVEVGVTRVEVGVILVGVVQREYPPNRSFLCQKEPNIVLAQRHNILPSPPLLPQRQQQRLPINIP